MGVVSYLRPVQCALHTTIAARICCCALRVQERAVPSLISAAWPAAAAAAAVVRTYQAPAAGPLLLQYGGSAGAGLPGFSSPPSLVGRARAAAGG